LGPFLSNDRIQPSGSVFTLSVGSLLHSDHEQDRIELEKRITIISGTFEAVQDSFLCGKPQSDPFFRQVQVRVESKDSDYLRVVHLLTSKFGLSRSSAIGTLITCE